MGKVDCIELPGYQLWFHSSDHLPPHVHIGRRGEWEIRVCLLDTTASVLAYELKWGNGPTGPEEKTLRKAIVQDRVCRLEEWEVKVCL